MEIDLKFFSEEWCAAALVIANSYEDLPKGLADPDSFTLSLAFECNDSPGTSSWARFEAGKVTAWHSGLEVPTGACATVRAAVDTWRAAAEGEEYGTDLLLGHKIKLKDTKNKVTYNYAAFEALLASWGRIPTDWKV